MTLVLLYSSLRTVWVHWSRNCNRWSTTKRSSLPWRRCRRVSSCWNRWHRYSPSRKSRRFSVRLTCERDEDVSRTLLHRRFSCKRLATECTYVCSIDKGIYLGDLFNNHDEIKDLLRSQMPGVRQGLIDGLFESSVKLIYVSDRLLIDKRHDYWNQHYIIMLLLNDSAWSLLCLQMDFLSNVFHSQRENHDFCVKMCRSKMLKKKMKASLSVLISVLI